MITDKSNIVFDDYVVEELSVWSQVCNGCAQPLPISRLQLMTNTTICGVQGCENNAEMYYDLKNPKKLTI